MKRKNPSTSTEAYRSIDPEHLRKMYKDILWALGQMPGGGTFEELAKVLKVKDAQVWRRLNEVERMGLIYRAGRKALNSGRQGTLWKVLVEGAKVVMPEKFPAGKTAHEHAKSIIQQAQLF